MKTITVLSGNQSSSQWLYELYEDAEKYWNSTEDFFRILCIFGSTMSFECHSAVNKNSKWKTNFCCFYFHLCNISKFKPLVFRAELGKIIYAFIPSRLDYFNNLFTSLNKKELECLQVVPNSAASPLTGTHKRTRIMSVLHFLQLNFRIHVKISSLNLSAIWGQQVWCYLCPKKISFHGVRWSFLCNSST